MSTAVNEILSTYERRTPGSRALAEEAQSLFPGGIVHDARYFQPYPIYVERAAGARKWDVDGNEYVDYVGGHGALLLGHAHPEVTAAVQAQLEQGTHFGACHRGELEWARSVQRLMPSAERVRFTSSGTEATLLAWRLARAFTGKPLVVRFNTHFHGWHDHAAFGVASHHDGTPTPGVLPALTENTVLCPPGDLDALEQILETRRDVAAVILEPTGATWGQIPLQPSFVKGLRAQTEKHQVLLIFDEVVTGFRCAPGGAQQVYQIRPDLTTLAKILAGGLPGGAVAGRRDILERLDADACLARGHEKIPHHGTFNANPASAAAGIATLDLVARTDACQRASDFAARLRQRLNALFEAEQLAWRAYGRYSGFHLYTNPECDPVDVEDLENGRVDYARIKAASRAPVVTALRVSLRNHGVDLFGWPGGVTSAAHGEKELEQTVASFRSSIAALRDEGFLERPATGSAS